MDKCVLLRFVSLLLIMVMVSYTSNALAWSNGGYSDDPSNPDYGTHDWIAEHALEWLPTCEKQYILDHLAVYLYGTELPDNWGAPDGIGDTTKHHIYYWSNASLQDEASAVRAYQEYNNTLNYLKLGEYANASKSAGIMSHYIVDLTVFGHVMGANTDWGAEEHHSDYETYVNQRTSSYDAEFNTYLSFDGELSLISANDATQELAYDTTFDVDGDLTCLWMDQNYDWIDFTFRNRCGESLNLAVNYLADVLHTLYSKAAQTHNLDTGLDYMMIQEAINAPETLDGHTILVDAGTHYENVIIDKSISLVGEDRETTIIDGSEIITPIVHITANNVTVKAFTIQNGGRIYGWEGGGIYITNSNRNDIIDNTIKNTQYGINLRNSTKNIIIGNTIIENDDGLQFIDDYSNNSVIYHNNFINNSWHQIQSLAGSNNTWDNGFEGNYWSNYTGQDLNADGIGDNPYVIDTNNQDSYPLLGMFSDFNATSEYKVQTICNSTISEFEYNSTAISFNASGENGTNGFCRICIPTALINETYKVFVNNAEVTHTLLACSNSTRSYLYFTYSHSTQEVVIIPEFQTWAPILFILIVLTVALAIYKRMHA